MSGGSASPPPVQQAPQAPNYGPVLEATQKQIDFQREQSGQALDWAKTQYNNEKPYTDQVQQGMIDSMNFSNANAQKDRARYEQVYQPLENQIVSEATNWDSADRRNQARGQAVAGVGQSFDAADAAATANLERYGADPTSTRYASLDAGSKLARATAGAAASETADRSVQQTGINYRLQAANMGKGLPAQAVSDTGAGTSSGSAGVGAGNSTASTYMASLGNPMGWSSGVNQSIGGWGNMLGQQYQAQLGQFNANSQQNQNAFQNSQTANSSSSGVGSALGSIAGMAGMLLLAEGGDVDETATPGAGGYLDPTMSPSGGAQTDDIPATGPGGSAVRLNAHEFVMPADVVMHRGKDWMQKQVHKARKEMGDPNAGREAKPQVKPQALPHPRGVPMHVPRMMQHGARGNQMHRPAVHGAGGFHQPAVHMAGGGTPSAIGNRVPQAALPRGVNLQPVGPSKQALPGMKGPSYTGTAPAPPGIPRLHRMPGGSNSPVRAAVNLRGFR